jgi:hypothetical protein
VLALRGVVRHVETPVGRRNVDLCAHDERFVRPSREAPVSHAFDRDTQLVFRGCRADRVRAAETLAFDVRLDREELTLREPEALAQVLGDVESDDERFARRVTDRSDAQRLSAL